MIGDSNVKGNFLRELLLKKRQVSSIRKHLLIIYRLTLNFQKLNYQKRYSQEDF